MSLTTTKFRFNRSDPSYVIEAILEWRRNGIKNVDSVTTQSLSNSNLSHLSLFHESSDTDLLTDISSVKSGRQYTHSSNSQSSVSTFTSKTVVDSSSREKKTVKEEYFNIRYLRITYFVEYCTQY